MKIGIVTFVNEINYGCSLQGFALQRTVSKLGDNIECVVVDYSRNRIKDSIYWILRKVFYKLFNKNDYPSWTIKEYLDILRDIRNTQTQSPEAIKLFHDFWKLSDRTKKIKRKDLHKLNEEYDFFIVGSDQVWNCGRLNIDKTFFLDFVKDDSKKGSYAASLGLTEIPSKYKAIYSSYLSKFKSISCREKSGQIVLQRLLGKNVYCHLDPTFLLDKDEWIELITDVKGINKPYVLAFVLEESKTLREFAENISRDIHIPIIYVNCDLTCSNGMAVGPREFVKLILEAECVVTNSFHGIAMSINLQTNFYVELAQSDYMKSVASRIYDLFDTFSIHKDHMFSDKDYIRNYDKIDFCNIEEKLEHERNISISFLRNMINGKRSEK